MAAVSVIDFKLGARMLRRHPGLSFIGGLALAVAIAIGSLAFQLLRNQVNPSLPLDEGDRVVRIENFDRATGALEPHSLYDFGVWRDELRTVEQIGAARSMDRNLILPAVPPQPVPVAEITPSAFALTRVSPRLGRPLVEADAVVGAPDVVVIGYQLWQDRLGGDPAIVGTTVQLGDTRAAVVGVMPEGFGFPRYQQAWLPLRVRANAAGEGPPVLVFGRLAPGATLERASAEIQTVAAQLATEDPTYRERMLSRVLPFATEVLPLPTPVLMLGMFIAVSMVLLGISANVATLMFARTALRESEIVVRTALGATRRRIIAQLMVESLVLAGAATVAGLLIARGILQIIWHQRAVVQEESMPFWSDPSLSPVTVLWAIGLALVGSAVVGLLPGLKATGSEVRGALARTQADASGMRFGGIWSFVIVAQVAFSVLALPVAIGTTQEGLRDARARETFPYRDYLSFEVGFDEAEGTRLDGAYAALERRLLSEPSVDAVTRASGLPGGDRTALLLEAQRGTDEPYLVFGRADDLSFSFDVDLDFFEVFGLSVVAGRALGSGDLGAPTVLINETLARNLGGNPLGMHLRRAAPRGDGGVIRGEPEPWLEVVGVVANAVGDEEIETIYRAAPPAELNPGYFAVRLRDDPGNLAGRIPTLALEVDPGLRVYRALPLHEVMRIRAQGGTLAYAIAMSVIALAVTLSAAGLFALMAVAVQRRTREIGVRLALGASGRGVLRALFARAAAQLAGGIVIGNLLVFGVRSLTASTGASFLLPMLAVSAGMAFVGMAACVVPARRALRVQPTEAIRDVW